MRFDKKVVKKDAILLVCFGNYYYLSAAKMNHCLLNKWTEDIFSEIWD